jgi:hypothetical protein
MDRGPSELSLAWLAATSTRKPITRPSLSSSRGMPGPSSIRRKAGSWRWALACSPPLAWPPSLIATCMR